MSSSLRTLVTQHAGDGRLDAIVLRPKRRESAVWAERVQIEPGRGLLGDHRSEKLRVGDEFLRREVTLIQAEHLPLLAAWSGRDSVDARDLRRNLVVAGVNLLALDSPFPGDRRMVRIGDHVLLEVTGPCAPCSRMETILGRGGYNAMCGHGGVTARVVQGGWIQVGDPVLSLSEAEALPEKGAAVRQRSGDAQPELGKVAK